MTKPEAMRDQIRAEIRLRWKGMSRRQLGCRKGGRNRRDVWMLASDMPSLILRVIARELAAGCAVSIPGFGTFYARLGGTTRALRGNRPGCKTLPPRRVPKVCFSETLVRAVPGDGTRRSLRFRAAPLLKKAVQPDGPPLKRTRRKAVAPGPPVPTATASRRPMAPLAEIVTRRA